MIYYAKAKISLGAVEAKGKTDLKCSVPQTRNPFITDANPVVFDIQTREKDEGVGTVFTIPVEPVAVPHTDHYRFDAGVYASRYVCMIALLLKDKIGRNEKLRVVAPPWIT